MIMPQLTIDLMEAYMTLGPLALIIMGITVYGVFVFNFYRFLARKDIFTLNLQKHNQARRPALRKTITVIFYVFKCLMLYPVFVFFWFAVMVALLYLLSRNQPVEIVMLVAMGVVGAIRTCSYYKEALATDIAKILPFALLGIMLIDNSIIRILDSTDGVREAALQWETVVYYLVAVVTLEFVLRMATGIFNFFRNRRKARKAQKHSTLGAPTGHPSKPESVRQAHESAEPVAPQPEFNGPVSEPRPVGQSPATFAPTTGRAPAVNPVPSFVNASSDAPRSPSVESLDRGSDPRQSWSPVSEPIPVGQSSAAFAPSFDTLRSGAPADNAIPSFLEGRANVPRRRSVELPDFGAIPQSKDIPEAPQWGRSRPAYASSSTESE